MRLWQRCEAAVKFPVGSMDRVCASPREASEPLARPLGAHARKCCRLACGNEGFCGIGYLGPQMRRAARGKGLYLRLVLCALSQFARFPPRRHDMTYLWNTEQAQRASGPLHRLTVHACNHCAARVRP